MPFALTKGKNQTIPKIVKEQTRISPLSTAQAKLLGATVSVVCFAVLFTLATLLIQLLGDFMSSFSAVIWPLAIASILTLLLKPLVRKIEKCLGIGKTGSILLIYLFVVVVGSLTVWALGGEVIRQCKELASSSMDWPERMEGKISESIEPETWSAVAENFQQFKKEWKEGISTFVTGVPELSQKSAHVLKNAWSGIGSFFSLFATLAIVPIYLFYFLGSNRDHSEDWVGQLTFLNQQIRHDLVYLVQQLKDILEGFFRGQLIIGGMMGIGYAIGFSLSGLKFGIALGLFFGVLNIVPYLGTILGVVSILAVSYLQTGGILETGQWNILWGCGITFLIVQLIESYWLSPKVMGDRTGLHPVVIIASVFFWGTALNGILGMILGIPLTAFMIVFWRLLRRKYFAQVSES